MAGRLDRGFPARRLLALRGVALSFCLNILLVLPAHGRAASVDEYQLKVAYLYNFAKFVEWPALQAGAPLRICVLGADPFGEGLDRLAGRKVGDHVVEVQRLGYSPEGVAACNIVFISRSEVEALQAHLQRLDGEQVLTVSDIDGFLDQGGMVELRTIAANVKFAVNLAPADSAQLKVSSFLLQIALDVQGR